MLNIRKAKTTRKQKIYSPVIKRNIINIFMRLNLKILLAKISGLSIILIFITFITLHIDSINFEQKKEHSYNRKKFKSTLLKSLFLTFLIYKEHND